jgi:hypothetical protein
MCFFAYKAGYFCSQGAREWDSQPAALEPTPPVSGVLLRRLSASPLGTVTAIDAIVRQDDRRPSNGATGGGRPLLLLDALSGNAGVDMVVTAYLLAAARP